MSADLRPLSWAEVRPLVRPEPLTFRAPRLTLRHASRSPFLRLVSRLLVRLLVLSAFPPQWVAWAALFPVSLLWPVVVKQEAAVPSPCSGAEASCCRLVSSGTAASGASVAPKSERAQGASGERTGGLTGARIALRGPATKVGFSPREGRDSARVFSFTCTAGVGASQARRPRQVDPDSNQVCSEGSQMRFSLCAEAKVTLTVAGTTLSASVDGGAAQLIDGIPLTEGPHTVRIEPAVLGATEESTKPFRIDARAVADEAIRDQAEGQIASSVCNRSLLPVAHTMVKDQVDAFDGHLAFTEVDFALPGRHLPLEMSRTYSSAGVTAEGVMGPGWSWNYGLTLEETPCDLITLQTLENSQVFRRSGSEYTPQKGYNGRLVAVGDTFDYFDKGNVQYRFGRVPGSERLHRIESIREPHGDRLVMTYDLPARLTKVTEEQGGVAVREMRLTYERSGVYDRISRVEVYAAGATEALVRVDYEHHEVFGTLDKATRLGRNVDGGPRAENRVTEYAYSTDDLRDRFQMTERVDPNGNRTRYQYYVAGDTMPGEGGWTFFVGDKLERVKAVYEYPDPEQVDVAHALKTEFLYDVTQAQSGRHETTVKDPLGRETRYVQNGAGATTLVQAPMGRTTETTWYPDMRRETQRDANLRLTRYTWDGKGNPASETIETTDLGHVVTLWEYDPTFGKLVSTTDGENRTTTWTLDPQTGDVTEQVDAEGNRTTSTYVDGLLRTRTDARGATTTYSDHDGFGQARTVEDALGNRTHRMLDSRGREVLVTDDLGRRTERVFDGLDRVVSERRVAGGLSDDQVTLREYNAKGQVTAETNANGARTDFTRDGVDRLTATVTRFGGRVLRTEMTYGKRAQKETETDARGVRRRYVYDDLDRVTQVLVEAGPSAGPLGEVAAFGYDLLENKVWETDVAGLRTDYEYDRLYRVKKKLLPESGASGRYFEEYVYDRVGNRTLVRDANGHETRSFYDRLDRLTRMVRDPGGLALTTEVSYCNSPAPDPPGGTGLLKCEEHETPKGLRTTYTRDLLGRERSREVRLEGEDGDPAIDVYLTQTEYRDRDHEVLVTDPNGSVTRTTLDGLDRETERVVDDGRLGLTTRTSYDGLGNAKLVVDPRNNSTHSDYDGLGRLVRRTDAKNASSLFDYDGGGLRTLEVNRRGVRKKHLYDNLGRQVRSSLESAPFSNVGWSQRTEYLDRERIRKETDARGKVTEFKLDGLGRAIEEKDALGKTAFTAWDGVNKVSETDRRNHKTTYAYDAVNRLVTTTDPAPFQTQTLVTTYDDALNLRTEKDRRGKRTATQLDALGRVRSVTAAVGEPEVAVLERSTYDGAGNKIVALDAEGHETRFTYDGANRVVSRTDGYGSAQAAPTTYAYDASGNQTLERDKRSADLDQPFSVRKAYDQVNRLTDVEDGLLNLTHYDYDAEGNKTLTRTPKGQETTYAYDELGKTLAVTQPSTAAGVATTRYAYDENRNKTSQEDANGHVVRFEYDDLNRLTKLIQPGSLTTEHRYDDNGNETTLIDPKGQTVTSTYDELDRLKTKSYAFATGDTYRPWRHVTGIVTTYDENGNVTQVDEDIERNNGPPFQSKTTRAYDPLNRLVSETIDLPEGLPSSRTVTYAYYWNGARQSVTDPGGEVTFYTYDGKNRLRTTTTGYGTPEARTTTWSYWPDDLVQEVLYPNGVKATYAYDRADRLTRLVNAKGASILSSYAYEYDQNGNRTSQVEQNGLPTPTVETTTYTYDELDRLASVTYPDKSVTYGYDLVGNRTGETERDGAGTVLSNKTAVFDDLNRLTSITDPVAPANDTTLTWDANGNQTSKAKAGTTTAYRYDIRDKLVEVEEIGTGINGRFTYDFEGRRNVKVGEFGTEQYVHDGQSTFVEYDQTGATKAKYDYGDRLVSLFRSDEGRRYFHQDGLRSVTSLSDDAGTAVASYHLDAWGTYRDPSELDRSKNRFGLTGHLFDRETGLYFARARYLSPELGRFLTQDSFLGNLDDPPSLHRFGYANQNPLRYVDPTGRQSVERDEKAVVLARNEAMKSQMSPELSQALADLRAQRTGYEPAVPEPPASRCSGFLCPLVEPLMEGGAWVLDKTVGRLTRWWDERGAEAGAKVRERVVAEKPSEYVLANRRLMTEGLPPEILAADQGTQQLGTRFRETTGELAEKGTRTVIREGGVGLSMAGTTKLLGKSAEVVEEAAKPLVGTQNPTTAWAAKTGRAYDRRVTRFWRRYEGQTVGDWTVESVNRRLAPGVQPDVVLVNESTKTIVIHDTTSKAASSHLAKGAGYQKYFEAQRPGYAVKYSEGYWEGLENSWEALSKKGELYFPGQTKPPGTP